MRNEVLQQKHESLCDKLSTILFSKCNPGLQVQSAWSKRRLSWPGWEMSRGTRVEWIFYVGTSTFMPAVLLRFRYAWNNHTVCEIVRRERTTGTHKSKNVRSNSKVLWKGLLSWNNIIMQLKSHVVLFKIYNVEDGSDKFMCHSKTSGHTLGIINCQYWKLYFWHKTGYRLPSAMLEM